MNEYEKRLKEFKKDMDSLEKFGEESLDKTEERIKKGGPFKMGGIKNFIFPSEKE